MIRVIYSELDGPEGLTLRMKRPATRAMPPPGRTSSAPVPAP